MMNPGVGSIFGCIMIWQMSILAYRSLAYQEQWWEIALLPIRIFFQGQDNDPQHFDGRLNPLLFVFPFFLSFTQRPTRKPLSGKE